MEGALDKPLPEPPLSEDVLGVEPAKDMGRLSISAQAHLRRFIKHALEEKGVDDTQEWAKSLELALKELCGCLNRRAWLAGLKAARKTMSERKREEEKATRALKEEETKGDGGQSNGRERGRSRSSTINVKVGDRKLAVDADDKSSSGYLQPKKRDEEQKRWQRWTRLHDAIEQSSQASGVFPAHFLLTLSPKGVILPSQNVDFELIPSSKLCLFSPDKFRLPSFEELVHGNGPIILFGLDEWEAESPKLPVDPRIVGGTFSFTGVASSGQFQALRDVLRYSIYICMSLILEQHVFSDSNVQIQFPALLSAQPLVFSYTAPEVLSPQDKPRQAKPRGSGIWSFLSRKTGNLLNRALQTPISHRVMSLETTAIPPPISNRDTTFTSIPSQPQRHSRRISFSISSVPFFPVSENMRRKEDSGPIFSSALARIAETSQLLSTSAGVVFPPPHVLMCLAEKERHDPGRKLLGSEKVALCSLLGWEGRASRGKGMAGLCGFLRHQGISFLYAEYVPLIVQQESSTSSTIRSGGSSPTEGAQSESEGQDDKLVPCDRGRWRSFRYYRKTGSEDEQDGDKCLGETIESLCTQDFEPDSRCSREGCNVKRLDHRRIWVHGGVRVSAEMETVQARGENYTPKRETEMIHMWVSCAICGRATGRKSLTDGTYLSSFAKYLELLVYSPFLCVISPSLCDHTTPPPLPWPPKDNPPQSRFNIIRHFAYHGFECKFRVARAPASFELRVPRLHVVRGRQSTETVSSRPLRPGIATGEREKSSPDIDEDKRALRREIKRWWQGVADEMDRLEERFADADTDNYRKSLPRLPSSDDAYQDDSAETPRMSVQQEHSSVHESISRSPVATSSSDETPTPSRFTRAPSTSTDETPTPSTFAGGPSSGATSRIESSKPSHLLISLRHCFQQQEQSLYTQLSQTSSSNLNDVRRSFAALSRGAARRLTAWETKHVTHVKHTDASTVNTKEPEWWKPNCHAIPGSNVIVREDEWGSIIAYTLTSMDYQREMINNQSQKSGSSTRPGSPDSHTLGLALINVSTSSNTSSTMSDTSNKAHPTPKPPLDPDTDSAGWYEPESHSSIIMRQEQLRDHSGILSLRDVLRNKRSPDINSSGIVFGGSKFSPTKFMAAIAGGTNSPRPVAHGTPPSAWAQPAVELNMHAADGQISGLPDVESAERVLQEMESSGGDASHKENFFASHWKTLSGFPESSSARPRRPPSLVSTDSESVETVVQYGSLDEPEQQPRCSMTGSSNVCDANDYLRKSSTASMQSPNERKRRAMSVTDSINDRAVHQHQQSSTTTTSYTASIASTVSTAMRLLLHQPELPRPSSPAFHHKLLALDNQGIEDRPHIKHEWSVGKRLKFSCTVYYAKQFDYLRRRCGIEDIFAKSLEHSENWAAEGGKSKANFWKTSDDRFVIKTLVNAWNVADLQVLIDLGPAYFRYVDSTSNKASVLAKFLGFYTVEVKNLESGTMQAKADLLVMENLFYDHNATKAFDLKGIQGRKVKATGVSSGKKTLFDGDWLEDQQKALILVYPHSKLVLQEAIRSDADFLCRNNIMDYSLLLGVDEVHQQIACGLVDTIGSYTVAKTLEYKAKQNLNSGKDVTVVPPNEYQDRFINAMDNYFLACPDKWSRPFYDSFADHATELPLPSVL